MPLIRTAGLLAAILLAACTTEIAQETRATEVGEGFKLDQVVVVVDDPTVGAFSRKAKNGEIEAAVSKAVRDRFSRFDGTAEYSIGIKVQAYILALPGIPVVAAPKSLLAISVNVYDDVPRRLNDKPKNMTIFESAGGDAVVGSGYTQSGEEQLAEMSANAAIEIEKWLRKNEQWFTRPSEPSDGAETETES